MIDFFSYDHFWKDVKDIYLPYTNTEIKNELHGESSFTASTDLQEVI